LTTIGKILLGVALAVSYAPFLGFLLLGLLFLPMQLALLLYGIFDLDPESIHTLPIILPILGGLAGVAAMHNVVGRVYGLPVKSHDPRLIMSGLILGLLALFGSLYVTRLVGFTVFAAVVTAYIVYLDRKFLFGGRDHNN